MGSNNRNRTHEPGERRRAELRAQKRCIGCGLPSETQRCAECRQKVEANTNRYRGHGKPGRVSLIDAHKSDARYAVEELTKFWHGLSDVEQAGTITPRKRDEMLAAPLSHAHLSWKFLGEILKRAGLIGASRPRAPRPTRTAIVRKRPRNHPVDPRQLALPLVK